MARSYGGWLLGRKLSGEFSEQVFRQQRNGAEANARGVPDGIQDCGSGPIMRQFADSLCPIGSMLKRNLLKENVNGRHVLGGGHDVVGHLVVGHVAVLQEHLFVERVTDALRDAAFDLTACQHRIEHSTNFLDSPEFLHFSRVCECIHSYLRYLDRPAEGRISLSAILLVVPEYVWRSLVAAERFHLAI